MKPDEFWNMTYAEFLQKLDGFKRNQARRSDELLFLAWHVEAFARQKKLPDLKAILSDGKKPEPSEQKPEDMLAIVTCLNAALGGEVVYQ